MVLRGYSIGCYCSTQKFNFYHPERTFCDGQLQSSFSDALEDCSDVFYQLCCIICGDSNAVYILQALVGFVYWVEVLSHEA